MENKPYFREEVRKIQKENLSLFQEELSRLENELNELRNLAKNTPSLEMIANNPGDSIDEHPQIPEDIQKDIIEIRKQLVNSAAKVKRLKDVLNHESPQDN